MKSRTRRLNVGGMLQGVPTWGTCDKCGTFFSVPSEFTATAESAREKLLSDFDAHVCKGSTVPERNGGSVAKARSPAVPEKES